MFDFACNLFFVGIMVPKQSQMPENRLTEGPTDVRLHREHLDRVYLCPEAFIFSLHEGDSERFCFTRSSLVGLHEKCYTWLALLLLGKASCTETFILFCLTVLLYLSYAGFLSGWLGVLGWCLCVCLLNAKEHPIYAVVCSIATVS